MNLKKKSNILFSILLVLSLTTIMGACSNNKTLSVDRKDLSLIRLEGTFTVDVDNPNETVGDADYVFEATVNQIDNTVYKNPVQVETDTDTKEISTPYTNYQVTIVKNIKGDLPTGNLIPIQKAGGIDENESSIVLYDEDALPEVNKTYVFLAYAQDDGSLLVSGPNSNVLVEGQDSNVIQTYRTAFENQIVTNRLRSTFNPGIIKAY